MSYQKILQPELVKLSNAGDDFEGVLRGVRIVEPQSGKSKQAIIGDFTGIDGNPYVLFFPAHLTQLLCHVTRAATGDMVSVTSDYIGVQLHITNTGEMVKAKRGNMTKYEIEVWQA
jgi:hypothetical protein